MTSTNNSEEDIFREALEISSPESRAEYIQQACGDNDALGERVAALLRVAEEQQSFLEAPPAPLQATAKYPTIAEGAGTTIGTYKLLEQIGEGGMGVVFMAEQREPVRRKVALKIIKPGMDSRQVIARFEAERQALAMMEHPNIARALDAGATETGCPYFVMELVRGVPITQYCDEAKKSTRERLELFVDVCRAIQHAHQKGIIHRDIKPSNVLITLHDGVPVAKVIDFGIAKAITGSLTNKTLFTGFAQFVGTPLYVSPEQAELSGLDIDTRSDVYSLGVLLYELLTGSLPFEKERLEKATFDELRRIIREEDPPRMSARLSKQGKLATTLSEQRRSNPRALSRLFRGELDWIVMMALEKDRNRRYETANGFARDVQHYLADEPVEACPPSLWYRARKFARRQRTTLSIALVVLCSLTLLAVGLGWVIGDRNARRHEATVRFQQARSEVEEAIQAKDWKGAGDAINHLEGMLDSELPESAQHLAHALHRDLEMVRMLREARLLRSDTRGNLNDGFGGFNGLRSVQEYRRIFQDYGLNLAALSPEDAAQRIRSSRIRWELIAALDDWSGLSVSTVEETRAARSRLSTIARLADDDDLRNRMRLAFQKEDRPELLRIAEVEDLVHWPVATVLVLVDSLRAYGEQDLIVTILTTVHRRCPDDFWLNHALAMALKNQGPERLAEATGYFRATIALQPKSAGVRWNFGNALKEGKRYKAAVYEYQEALRLNPRLGLVHKNLGESYFHLRETKKAIAHHRKAVKLLPDYYGAHNSLGAALDQGGKYQEALKAFRVAIRLKSDYGMAHYNAGKMLGKLKRSEEAIAAYRKAIQHKHNEAEAHVEIGDLLKSKNQLEQSIVEYKRAIELNGKSDRAWNNLGIALRRLNRFDAAIEAYRTAIKLSPKKPLYYNNLAIALGMHNRHEEAAAVLRKAIDVDSKYLRGYLNLGLALRILKQWDESIEVYQKALKLSPTSRVGLGGLNVALRGKFKAMTQPRELLELQKQVEESIKLQPEYHNFLCLLGSIHSAQNQRDLAIKAWQQSLEINNTCPNTHYNLGLALVETGKVAEGIQSLRECIRQLPEDGDAHAALAWQLVNGPDLRERRLDEGLKMASRAVGLAPKLPLAWQVLGWAKYRKEDWKGCIESLEKAIKLEKGEGRPEQWLFLAMAHYQLENTKEAQNYYDQSIHWINKRKAKSSTLARMREEAQKVLGVGKPSRDTDSTQKREP